MLFSMLRKLSCPLLSLPTLITTQHSGLSLAFSPKPSAVYWFDRISNPLDYDKNEVVFRSKVVVI